MKAAIVKDGIVVNLIVVESLDVLPGIIDAQDAHIGDEWDGEQFIRKEPQPTPDPTPPRMTEDEKEQLILSQSEMIAMLFERVLGGGTR